MKIYSIICVVMCAFSVLGQQPSPTPIILTAKQQKELVKQQEKDAKKQKKSLRNGMRVNLAELAAFPKSFVGQTKYAEGLSLGELRNYKLGSEVVYGVAIRSAQQADFWNFFSPDGVVFMANESQAHQIFSYYQKQKDMFHDWYPAKIVFTVESQQGEGRTYYVAKFTCIEFIGFMSRTWETVGSCQ